MIDLEEGKFTEVIQMNKTDLNVVEELDLIKQRLMDISPDEESRNDINRCIQQIKDKIIKVRSVNEDTLIYILINFEINYWF